MAKIAWADGFNLGVESLDADHRYMFTLLTAIYDTVEAGRMDDVPSATETLIDFCAQHFADEERLMANLAFPGLAEHQGDHADVMGSLEGFLDRARRSAIAPGDSEAVACITASIADHMVRGDLAVKSFLEVKGVAKTPVRVR